MAIKLSNLLNPGGIGKKLASAALGSVKAGSAAVSVASGVLATAMIAYSGYVLYDTFDTEQRAYNSSVELMQYKPEVVSNNGEPTDGKETLASINKDYRGWLTLNDTNVDYPVVQGPDDLYYASYDVYQNVSLTGAIYLAAGNNRTGSDTYNLIYGHHMDNGAMFGSLDRYRDGGFRSSHRVGTLVTESGVYDLMLFAVAETDAYESQIYTVGNRAGEVKAFLTGDRSGDAGLGTRVLYYDRETAAQADRIVALSTCDSAETYGRLVVFFRMIPRVQPTDTPAPTEGSAETPTPAATEGTPTASPTATPSPTPTATPTPTAEPDPTATPTVRPRTTPVPTTPSPEGPFTLTIRYVYSDGTPAAATYQEQLMPGDTYNVQSPSLAGYVTGTQSVAGTMGSADVTVVVIYLPSGTGPEDGDGDDPYPANGGLVSITDYEVPLGLDNLHAQMGVCVE